MPPKERICDLIPAYSAGEIVSRNPGKSEEVPQTCTSCCESLKESGRKRMVFTALKMAVLAPMPSARVRTATRVKPGFFTSMRRPKRRSCQSVPIFVPPSFIAQRDHRIHVHRPPRRDPAGCQGHAGEQGGDSRKRRRVVRGHAEKLTREQSRQQEASRNA